MKDKLRKVLRVVGVVLILFGAYQLASPYISNWLIENNILKQEEVYNGLSAEDLAKNKNTDAEFDFDAVTAIDPSKTLLDPSDINPDLILGNLFIPTIDVNLVLFKGLDNSILNAGVGTMRPDQEMGVGNYPIAGHWARKKDLLLASLDQLKEGDKIYITDKGKLYEYEMFSMRVVNDTEVQWIEDQVAEQHGAPIISLMNCYYEDEEDSAFVSTPDQRLFVFGELKDVSDYDEKEFKARMEKEYPREKKKTKKKNKKAALSTPDILWELPAA